MSYKVLVVPEDPTHNGDILQPLVARMLSECGKPNAEVIVLTNPKVSGYEHAKERMPEILDRYRHFDLAVFLVDADGKDRSGAFQQLEADALRDGTVLFCASAEQEVEVWLLAGHTEKLSVRWTDVRGDTSVKENIFEPFLEQHGDRRRYGRGRDLLMKATLSNYAGLLKRCPELKTLQDRIGEHLAVSNG